MKALVVVPYYYPKIGGLEIYAQQLAIALKEYEGWEIVIATSNHQGHKLQIDEVNGMKVYRLGTMLKFSNTPLNPLWPLQLRNIIKREKPDVILSHTPVPSMSDAVALAAGDTPLLVTYHAATLMKGDSAVFNVIVRAYKRYERLTFKRAARILAVSQYVKDELPSDIQAKTAIVPNAVWKRDITHRVQPAGVHFLFVGSLEKTHSWKGLDQIIEAFKIYQDAYGTEADLTVMGDGNYRYAYEEQVAKLGLTDKVTFTGALTGEPKYAVIKSASALIAYPKTANDAFPTVILEAWAREVPVIAAAIGPMPSLVNDQQDGYLVAPHDPTALAMAMHSFARSSIRSRETIARAAALRTAEHYTWEQQARAVALLANDCK